LLSRVSGGQFLFTCSDTCCNAAYNITDRQMTVYSSYSMQKYDWLKVGDGVSAAGR